MSSWLDYRSSAIGDIIEKELHWRARERYPPRPAPSEPFDPGNRIKTLYTIVEDPETGKTEIIYGDPERDALEARFVYVLSERLKQRQETE